MGVVAAWSESDSLHRPSGGSMGAPVDPFMICTVLWCSNGSMLAICASSLSAHVTRSWTTPCMCCETVVLQQRYSSFSNKK